MVFFGYSSFLHDIAEILLKVVLNTINLNLTIIYMNMTNAVNGQGLNEVILRHIEM
jgi:hypothetical protein